LRAALGNIERVGAYISEDNPAAAAETVERIREAVGLLQTYPNLGRPGRVDGTRELVVAGTPFIVPYRIRGDVIEIIRVFHGAQRWPARF
jgi:toxin ParE1/3/4